MQTLEHIAAPATNGDSSAHPFLWDVETYTRACRMGLFEGRRVELIEGEILDLNAQTGRHMVGISKMFEALLLAFPRSVYKLTNQGTLYSIETSRPEPDVAVFRADWDDIVAEEPMCPILVAEVSLETLAYDQGAKASFYANLGVREYWVLNLRDECLEVRRNPQPMASQKHGAGYASLEILNKAMSAGPLELPHVVIPVADLLP